MSVMRYSPLLLFSGLLSVTGTSRSTRSRSISVFRYFGTLVCLTPSHAQISDNFILQSIIISSIIFGFCTLQKYVNPQRIVNILMTVLEKLYWLSSCTLQFPVSRIAVCADLFDLSFPYQFPKHSLDCCDADLGEPGCDFFLGYRDKALHQGVLNLF